ncbi:MAG: nitroreductase family protein [Paludibacteraceae bacterium]|nr:nitroreductase family protein [Paludibacteraceae bacterium]MBP6283845.1 nitroreductase family protein [Paludibacteraceae bacterium]
MIEFLKDRATVRQYTYEPVLDETLNELFEAAFRASNTGNMQLYSVVVTRDEEMKQQLAPCHFNQPSITQAPVVLTFCADFNRFTQWCEYNKAIPGYENFISFFTAAIDATIMAQTFAIAAESKGLGICYFGTTNYLTEKISTILQLPRLVVPITTITLGYPVNIPIKTDRLPLQGLIHKEVYHDYSKESIQHLYAEKENLPEMKQFVADNNKETLAQVFTDVRYTKKNNETFSAMLLDFIKKQGFTF